MVGLEGDSSQNVNQAQSSQVEGVSKESASPEAKKLDGDALEINQTVQETQKKSKPVMQRLGGALQKGVKGAGIGRAAMNLVLLGKAKKGISNKNRKHFKSQFQGQGYKFRASLPEGKEGNKKLEKVKNSESNLSVYQAQGYSVERAYVLAADGKGELEVLRFGNKTQLDKGTIVWHNMQDASWRDPGSQDTLDGYLQEGYDVVMYDYRGVMMSSGKVSDPQDLVDDAKVVHDFAASKGEGEIKHEGQSLGGAVAVVVTDQLLQERSGDGQERIGNPTSVNSFNTLGNVVKHLPGNKLGVIPGAIAKLGTHVLGFRLDAGKSAKNIQESGKEVNVFYSSEDKVIRGKAQLKASLGEGTEIGGKHTDAWNPSRHTRKIDI